MHVGVVAPGVGREVFAPDGDNRGEPADRADLPRGARKVQNTVPRRRLPDPDGVVEVVEQRHAATSEGALDPGTADKHRLAEHDYAVKL